MAAGSSNYWEDLRKQARQLENELDLKLVSFSKLCTSYSSSRDGRRDRYSSDTTPLLNGSSQDRMFETMAVEIEQLLGKLTGINDKMAEYTNSAGVPSLNAALMHTLQRHRDILQDYTHEFHKTKANFLAIRERENLLGSVRKDIESYKSGSGVNNRRTELFLKEHEHLRKFLWIPVEHQGWFRPENCACLPPHPLPNFQLQSTHSSCAVTAPAGTVQPFTSFSFSWEQRMQENQLIHQLLFPSRGAWGSSREGGM
uniref:Golgi SNAP receptor complex member 1 isoform X1 n=1 Tax=Agelaius phoeniceus TaxID=39638 RepID=UPI0023ECAFC5|nr:Golgi SNAP receptor complex member 1 isoform X1 [Agelaius phoeniceus]